MSLFRLIEWCAVRPTGLPVGGLPASIARRGPSSGAQTEKLKNRGGKEESSNEEKKKSKKRERGRDGEKMRGGKKEEH